MPQSNLLRAAAALAIAVVFALPGAALAQKAQKKISYEEAFKRELMELDDCIRTGRPPRTDGPGFRQDLEVLTEIARRFPA